LVEFIRADGNWFADFGLEDLRAWVAAEAVAAAAEAAATLAAAAGETAAAAEGRAAVAAVEKRSELWDHVLGKCEYVVHTWNAFSHLWNIWDKRKFPKMLPRRTINLRLIKPDVYLRYWTKKICPMIMHGRKEKSLGLCFCNYFGEDFICGKKNLFIPTEVYLKLYFH